MAPVLAARARGLASRRPLDPFTSPQLAEEAIRARTAFELRLLARWADDPHLLAPVFLDEDRRTLRAIARGLVANVVPPARAAGAIATPTLPQHRIDEVARAHSLAEMATILGDHPLAPAFVGTDLFAVEQALVRRYYALAGTHGDRALAAYLTQLVDVENVCAALLLAARGGELVVDDVFLPGGRLDRDTFAEACRDGGRDVLARAFTGTPLAEALFSPSPSAIEDAALAWQLATQTRLRLVEPLGLAPVLWFVLHRRDEARHVRREAWTLGDEP